MAYSHIFFIKVNFLLFQRLVVRRTSVFFADTPPQHLHPEHGAEGRAAGHQDS